MYKTNFHIPNKKEISVAFRSLSPAEGLVFWVLVIVFVASASVLFSRINAIILTEVPAHGGSFSEGVIGSPRFINPLLSISDSDKDLTALVYSGLMRATPEGTLIPDLASNYAVSDDGLEYTFTLKSDAVFQDGTPVSADDVVFTIGLTQDPILKSPKRASWDGVVVEKVDDKTVRFTLPQPYSPFLENTIIGILPKHLWKGVSAEQFPFSQLNIKPVGTGPFEISGINRNNSGLPVSYKLVAFKQYTLGAPYIEMLTFKFYSNEEDMIHAYESGEVDSINSISPLNARKLSDENARIETSPLPRIFGVFFNQNQSEFFADKTVRKALTLASPKQRIIEEVLKGYAEKIDGPVPYGLVNGLKDEETKTGNGIEEARALLLKDGWKPEEKTGVLIRKTKKKTERLQFSISTSNTPELKAVATILAETWKKLGADVETKFFEASDLNQNVIRPRRYDALLFGEIVGRELDLFSFWHSSQRNDPGLNIALYANITADKLLTDLRTNTERGKREALYKDFEDEIRSDVPATFLYSPLFIYAAPEKVKGLRLGLVTTSGERFLNIYEWYIETERVWPIFIRK